MPVSPHPIGIKVYGVDRLVLEGATVTITLGAESISGTTNAAGECILNTADLPSGWNVDDVVSIEGYKATKGIITESLTLTDAPQQLTLTLAETSSLISFDDETNQHVLNFSLLTSFDGEKITSANPLPVTHGEIDLITNPSTVWSITRGDGQPNYEEVTIGGVTYRRTFTYNASGMMTARSSWVKQ